MPLGGRGLDSMAYRVIVREGVSEGGKEGLTFGWPGATSQRR